MMVIYEFLTNTDEFSLIPHCEVGYYPQSIARETEAQRSEMTFLSSHNSPMTEPRLFQSMDPPIRLNSQFSFRLSAIPCTWNSLLLLIFLCPFLNPSLKSTFSMYVFYNEFFSSYFSTLLPELLA